MVTLDSFTNPTPKQYFYLTIGYVIFAGILSYFLAGFALTLVASIAGISLIQIAQQLAKTEKVFDKNALKKKKWAIFTIPISIVFYLTLSSNLLYREDFIFNKSELKQTTGVIPATSTSIAEGSGKHRHTHYYLVINDIPLHCGEDDYDDCSKIYAYKDKTATVYYQPKTKNGNLAYEIVVDNQAIYEFNNQLKNFQDNRNKENHQFFWAFVLYFLPSFYWLYAYRNATEYLEEMDDDEKADYRLANAETIELQNNQIQVGDYGALGIITLSGGILFAVICLIAFLAIFITKSTGAIITFLVLLGISIALFYYTHLIGKKNRDYRLANMDNMPIDNQPILKNDNGIIIAEVTNVTLSDIGTGGMIIISFSVVILLTFVPAFIYSLLNGVWLNLIFSFIMCGIGILMIYKPYVNAKKNRDNRLGIDSDESEEYQEHSTLYKIFRIVALSILIILFLLGLIVLFFYPNREKSTLSFSIIFLLIIGYGIKALW